MTTAKSLVTTVAGILLAVSTISAQDQNAASTGRSAVTVMAAATADRVRFTAPNTVVQIRLEVYATNGEKLVDNEIRGGNVIDWHLQDGQAERLRLARDRPRAARHVPLRHHQQEYKRAHEPEGGKNSDRKRGSKHAAVSHRSTHRAAIPGCGPGGRECVIDGVEGRRDADCYRDCAQRNRRTANQGTRRAVIPPR